MHIQFDPQIFSQKYGGISRKFTELIQFTKTNTENKVIFPLLYTENEHLKQYNLIPTFLPRLYENFSKQSLLSYSNHHFYTLNKKYNNFLLTQQKADLFIPTYYNPYFIHSIGKIPFVLTVHDMIHELYPQYFLHEKHTVANKKLLMDKAKKIVAISENTKRDILSIYPEIAENKIDVVHLSYSIQMNTAENLHESLKKRSYILFVGNREAYKNFTWFLSNASGWLIHNNIELICIGGKAFTSEEFQLINEHHLNNLAFQYGFNDDELAAYYKNAIAFVFPSQYEGFGIPIVEAMACGCPVVLTNASSFPEVALQAGVFFEPNDAESLVKALQKITFDQEYRSKILSLTAAQIEHYSWEKTATTFLKIYERAV